MASRRQRGAREGQGAPAHVTALRLGISGVTGMIAVAVMISGCSSTTVAARWATSSTPTSISTTTLPPTTSTSTSTTTTAPTVPPGRPLTGMVVGIDPGHNGRNYTDAGYLNQQVFNGRTMESCDTTGTQTDAGYPEHEFAFNVARHLRAALTKEGALVVMTRLDNAGLGPCIDQRAKILNDAKSNVAIDIHADGGPAGGRGFAILEPVPDGINDAIVGPSATFGADVQAAFLSGTGMPISTYDGTNGVAPRSDLAGLNLATEPKVLIECGNMRNATDAAMLSSESFQRAAALSLAQAITTYLTRQ